jgi:putative FmdB family regulatory protein
MAMPVYLYTCKDCGDMEVRQDMYDNTLSTCPKCNIKGLTKKFVPVGVKFSGAGFYSTDNRGK